MRLVTWQNDEAAALAPILIARCRDGKKLIHHQQTLWILTLGFSVHESAQARLWRPLNGTLLPQSSWQELDPDGAVQLINLVHRPVASKEQSLDAAAVCPNAMGKPVARTLPHYTSLDAQRQLRQETRPFSDVGPSIAESVLPILGTLGHLGPELA